MQLDRFSAPLSVCADPDCPHAGLSAPEHFGRHNPRCAELFIGRDSSEMLCELPAGHEGAHRGSVHRMGAG